MSDIREKILARLFEITKTVNPSALRMDFGVDLANPPALVLMDGEEGYQEEDGGHEIKAPAKMLMTPHVVMMFQASEKVGPLLSASRSKLVKAITRDEQIPQLTGISHGRYPIGARYTGCETVAQLEEGVLGFVVLHFSIVYLFTPDDL